MIHTRQNIDHLIADLKHRYSFHQLNEGFVKRTMEDEFKAIGAVVRPMADEHIQIWEAWERATGSQYLGRDW